MPARLLQVVRIWDGTIRPPAPKFVVCVDPENGLYFRINTEGRWPESVPIRRDGHAFRKYDSHIECGSPLELDDFVIDESIRVEGDLGDVSAETAAAIVARVTAARILSNLDRASILRSLVRARKP